MGTRFTFGVLGPLQVLCDGYPVPIKAPKQRELLTVLLLHANQVVAVDTLVGRLWGEAPPAGARNALQNHVLRLRRVLGQAEESDIVLTRPQGYLIDAEGDALDLHCFDSLVRSAKIAVAAGDAERASVLLWDALALWRGQPLSDIPSDLLQREVVPALTERWLSAVELRNEVDLQLGRHGDLLPELLELTTQHPLRERFWAQYMLALHRSGRQGDALDCYRTVSRLLLDELGIDPGVELRELHQRILTGDSAVNNTARKSAAARPTGNIPAEVTTFVGRRQQLAQTKQLLETARVVTLTGVGGVGKTRLALRVATDVAETFRDGAWLVDLVPLTEPTLLHRAVVEALGIYDQSARSGLDLLVHHVRGKQMLLLLDNCEHLADAAATLVLTLLRAAPGLRVLATSRHRLGVPGEHILVVPPLSVPSAEDSEDVKPPLLSYEAVALLADRGAAASGLRIIDEDPGIVTRLCQRLDGIPLAIELAAVRLSTLSIEEILDRLDDRFRLLTDAGAPTVPAYHQTLRGVVDWSYDLCSEAERLLWARLSVFAGGFDLAGAETVCAGEGIAREDVMDLLSGLVHKSILTTNNHRNRTRYRLLETIRQYGQQRLHDRGEDAALRLRHCDYYQGLVNRATVDWFSPRELTWMDTLRQELPNVRAALDYCLAQPSETRTGLEMAASLALIRCSFINGIIGECRHWVDRAIALSSRTPNELRTAALARGSFVALCQGDEQAATELLTECRDLASRLDDGNAVPALTFIEGAHALFVRGHPQAIPLLARARDQFRHSGQLGDEHMATMCWAMAAAWLGDRDTAITATTACLTEAEARKAAWAHSWALWCAGLMELRHGNSLRAAVRFRDSLQRQRNIGDHWGPVWGVEALAWTAAAINQHYYAAQLLGAAHKLRQTTGVALAGMPPFQDAHEEADRLIRRALCEPAYATAYEQGATTEDPIQLALNGQGRQPVQPSDRANWSHVSEVWAPALTAPKGPDQSHQCSLTP